MTHIDEYRVLDDQLPKLTDELDVDLSANVNEVRLYFEHVESDTLVINSTATSFTATGSPETVEYQFSGNDLGRTGKHVYRWVVERTNGNTESFPKEGPFWAFVTDQVNRTGSVSKGRAGVAGPLDEILFNESGSTPQVPSADDWGLYFDTNGDLIKVDENGTTTQVGGGGAGSAVEAQEDGVQLTTDTALLNWQSGLTATNPVGDDINLNVDESEVDHDSLSNFVTNEHVDHSGVSISAGTALTGGGDITASRTLNVDETAIDHDNLTNFVANEHVDHSGVSISAGNAMTGGGDITASRTLNVDESSINLGNLAGTLVDAVIKTNGDNLEWQVDVNDDLILRNTTDAKSLLRIDQDTGDIEFFQITGQPTISTHDHSSGGMSTIPNAGLTNSSLTVTAGTALTGGGAVSLGGSTTLDVDETAIDHDNLTNFVANEHVDHSTVSISSGSGLTGGGDLTSSRTLDVELDIDDSGANVGTGHNLNFTNNLTVTDQGGGQLDISASTGAGSAIEAQEDGVQLTTDTTLINWQSGLTATNPAGDDINVNVDESEVDHDSTQNFVANEHVDHSTVSVSGGTGLTGGGDLTASRTLNVNLTDVQWPDTVNTVASGASPYTISPGELVFTDTSSGQVEIDLPNSGGVNATDKVGIIVNDASNNTIIDPQTENINGLNSTVVLGDPGAARIIYWDGSGYYFDRVDNGELLNNTIGINGGDGLKNGGTPALGGSVTLDVEPADFAGAGLKDDGSDNLEVQDVRVVSSSLNAQDIDTILMDASGGARSVQLPTPSSDINVTVKKIDSSGNAVDITTPGAETIDGQTSLSITSQYTSRTIVSDGTDYYIV